MRKASRSLRVLPLALLLALACGDTGGGGAPPDLSTAASTDQAGQASGCGGARVLIAFFSDDMCTQQVGQRSYDTALSCFQWTAMGSSAQENSATRFQCYRDRLCYTQHPNTLDCGDGGFGQTDKHAKLGQCIKEPDGMLYSKLISGTESCPEAPAGFECPLSASRMGTAGTAACTTR